MITIFFTNLLSSPNFYYNSHYEKILATGEVKCIDDEIPFEIPNTWEWVRFKNLVQFSLGKTPERVDSSYWSPNDFPWVSIADMEDKTTLTKTKEFISQKALTEKFNNTFSPIGTLIMSFKLTIGKVSILGINSVHNEAIISIFPFINEDNIIRDYLYNFLSIITGYTASTDAIKGATLNSKKISEMLVPLPPLNEQKRIAQRIEEIQPLIDKYRVAQEQAEEMEKSLDGLLKKSVLQYAIQGKLVPQNSNEEPASALLEKIQQEKLQLVKEGKLKKKDLDNSVIVKGDDNKYYEKLGKSINDITDDLPFDIPNSWQWCKLSNIANLYTGNSINETEKKARYTDVVGTEYIATKDVWFDNSIDYKNGIAIPDKYIDDFRIAPANSVLMCIEGGSAGRKIGILSQNVCFGNKLCCFSPYADISEFIFYYLQSPLFFEIFSSNKNGIIGGVSVNNLKQLFIPLPPYEEIKRIIKQIKQILKGFEG